MQSYLPDSLMAMSINGENRAGWIEQSHWNNLAIEAGVSKKLVNDYLSVQIEKIEISANQVLSYEIFTDEERAFLHDSVLPIIK